MSAAPLIEIKKISGLTHMLRRRKCLQNHDQALINATVTGRNNILSHQPTLNVSGATVLALMRRLSKQPRVSRMGNQFRASVSPPA